MEIINHIAEVYAQKNTSELDDVLQEVAEYTINNHPHAHMLSGKVQGKMLEFISCMIKPKSILEVGTFTGFSALCLAKGLQLNGILHTIELREDDAVIAQKYFDKAIAKNIQLHIGDALQIISTINEEWDLVFMDADKINYINYYELILPKVKAGGWVIADNVLFHGQVLEEEIKGKNAKAIGAFNEHVAADTRVEQVMLTVRDGITVIKKL
ncbi:MAG: O-methyltransferase [Chitinophagaceae bacterium]|nr:O-methyltransferase [Chitinophagaceae bacterium]